MDKQEKHTEDLLSQYINPERIEKAPEGFTSKVMSVIETEKIPVRATVKSKKRTLVPYIFSVFIVILIITTFFIPETGNKTFLIPAFEFLKTLKLDLPEIDTNNIFSINLPSALMYVLIGIFLLSFLDRALYRVFHREK
ncbi:MAG: hypothetical protein IPH69_11615 [Bacteroidales bacterium]|nr:hypothetical protein [Bacteroidales bacterium]MBK7628519.1 hypothetical protein [Bacteroidales bacterium]